MQRACAFDNDTAAPGQDVFLVAPPLLLLSLDVVETLNGAGDRLPGPGLGGRGVSFNVRRLLGALRPLRLHLCTMLLLWLLLVALLGGHNALSGRLPSVGLDSTLGSPTLATRRGLVVTELLGL